MMSHFLSLVLFLPLAGMFVLLLAPNSFRTLRLIATGAAAVTFAASLLFIAPFLGDAGGFQFVDRAAWIPSICAQHLIGLDGISLLLVLLTTLISLLAIIASWNTAQDRAKLYYAMILLLETGV